MTIDLAIVLGFGILAGFVSGVVGTGASVIAMPLLVWQFGPREAVPVMAVAALLLNAAKLASWWRQTHWRAAAAFGLAAMPTAMLGARTLLAIPPWTVECGLGLFFLAMIPGRRWLDARGSGLTLWQLGVAGAVLGFLAGIVASTGPLSVPAFVAFGLAKGAFVATEAAGSLAIYAAKVATFERLGVLPWSTVLAGIAVGASMSVGAMLARRVLAGMDVARFRSLIDVVMAIAGLALLWTALRPAA